PSGSTGGIPGQPGVVGVIEKLADLVELSAEAVALQLKLSQQPALGLDGPDGKLGKRALRERRAIALIVDVGRVGWEPVDDGDLTFNLQAHKQQSKHKYIFPYVAARTRH